MSADKNKGYTSESYAIPVDVMADIAQVILQADLPHEIIAVKENKRQVVFSISYQSHVKYQQEAIQNIAEILKTYRELCANDTETIDWRES